LSNALPDALLEGYDGSMIGRLRGRVVADSLHYLLLDVGGVGYRIHSTPQAQTRLRKASGEVTLFTHLVVRDDALLIFGFETEEELSFFELLISVSGIGPKSGLALLAAGEIPTIKKAISASDTSYLTKVSGIGKKMAERIIVELRDKMEGGGGEEATSLREDVDVLEALKALGYGGKEARDALMKVSKGDIGRNEKLKAALRALGNGNHG